MLWVLPESPSSDVYTLWSVLQLWHFKPHQTSAMPQSKGGLRGRAPTLSHVPVLPGVLFILGRGSPIPEPSSSWHRGRAGRDKEWRHKPSQGPSSCTQVSCERCWIRGSRGKGNLKIHHGILSAPEVRRDSVQHPKQAGAKRGSPTASARVNPTSGQKNAQEKVSELRKTHGHLKHSFLLWDAGYASANSFYLLSI